MSKLGERRLWVVGALALLLAAAGASMAPESKGRIVRAAMALSPVAIEVRADEGRPVIEFRI